MVHMTSLTLIIQAREVSLQMTLNIVITRATILLHIREEPG